MGIPRFYKWIRNRYPMCTQFIAKSNSPVFDNLYFDLNGLIHIEAKKTKHKDKENLFLSVFKKIEKIFKKIQPKKNLFISVDGVSPRAKMNQQRNRRYLGIEKTGFDKSNISPGTVFMECFSQTMKYLITKKISTDSNWKNIKVIFSGPECPGEGEHKIQEFIRAERRKNSFETTRHCLYGKDADLILLALASHEEFFSILREDEDKPSILTLFHISIVRECISEEFCIPTDKLKYFIDDFVLIFSFFGNDFLPCLPGIEIKETSFNFLFDGYKQFCSLNIGRINENGKINMENLKKYLIFLCKEGKEERFLYYQKKFDFVEKTKIKNIVSEYYRGLQWIMEYYFQGLKSWSWFYPFYYAPRIEELVFYEYDEQEVFQQDLPLKPFEQQLTIFFPKNKHLLPEKYAELMEKNSPIIDFYPEKVKIQSNKKERFAILPQIDIKRIKEQTNLLEKFLTKKEAKRNHFGQTLQFLYSNETQPEYKSHSETLKDIKPNNCIMKTCCFYSEKKWNEDFKKQQKHVFFPTIKNIEYKTKMDYIDVLSKTQKKLVLIIKTNEFFENSNMNVFLMKRVIIDWPFYNYGTCISIITKNFIYTKKQDLIFEKKTHTMHSKQNFEKKCKEMKKNYFEKLSCLIDIKTIFNVCLEETNIIKEYPQQFVFLSKEQKKDIEEQRIVGYNGDYFGGLKGLIEKEENEFVIINFFQKDYLQQKNVLKLSKKINELFLKQKAFDFFTVCKLTKTSFYLLSKILSSFFIEEKNTKEKINIGMNLKFGKKNKKVVGLSMKDDNGKWYFTKKCVDMILEYKQNFSDLFLLLENLFKKQSEITFKDIKNFVGEELKTHLLKYKKFEAVSCEYKTVYKEDLTEVFSKIKNKISFVEKEKNFVTLKIKKKNIFDIEKKHAFFLGDRVVSLLKTDTVSFGSYGFVVGFFNSKIDVLFDCFVIKDKIEIVTFENKFLLKII